MSLDNPVARLAAGNPPGGISWWNSEKGEGQMAQIKAVVVYADGRLRTDAVIVDTLQAFQAVVGGYIEIVLGAEASYGRAFGVRHREPELGDTAAITAMREAFVEVLSKPSSGGPITGGKGWPARYAVRRIVWHVLDHAWEIQDKSLVEE